MFTIALAWFALVAVDAPVQAHASEPVVRAVDAQAPWTLDELLDALRQVETGGLKDEGRRATGDGGRAIGPYQIHRGYWQDAKLPGCHDDCRDPGYARRVVLAYWKRYAPRALEALDVQTLARVHNGGPDGARQDCTLVFWRKVERALRSSREARALEAGAKEKGKPVEAGSKKEAKPAPAKRKGSEYC